MSSVFSQLINFMKKQVVKILKLLDTAHFKLCTEQNICQEKIQKYLASRKGLEKKENNLASFTQELQHIF